MNGPILLSNFSIGFYLYRLNSIENLMMFQIISMQKHECLHNFIQYISKKKKEHADAHTNTGINQHLQCHLIPVQSSLHRHCPWGWLFSQHAIKSPSIQKKLCCWVPTESHCQQPFILFSLIKLLICPLTLVMHDFSNLCPRCFPDIKRSISVTDSWDENSD